MNCSEGHTDALYSRDGVNGNDSLDGGSASDTCLQDARERSIRNCPYSISSNN